jgi:TonB-linked SusC/RagA family outer membrane protein
MLMPNVFAEGDPSKAPYDTRPVKIETWKIATTGQGSVTYIVNSQLPQESQMSSWRRLYALVLGLLVLAAGPADAQQTYTITGRILDDVANSPLTGAQVSIRGTRFGGLTNAQGRYTILAQLAPGTYTVEAQMIGRQTTTQSVTLANERAVAVADMSLRTIALSLEEVVVTGTAAPTSRRAIGNAVSTVAGSTINEAPAATIDQALQGKIAGAVIQSNTGTPGGGVSVRLRGTSSIVAGAEPLYIVDGVIVDNNGDQQINFGYRSNPSNRLADLDPNDIERIEVLKGAAAAALYGSRANNGVVQIFTKRGRAGRTQFTAETRFTNAEVPKRIEFALTPVNVTFPANQPPLVTTGVTRFDHQDLLFRSPWSHDSYLGLSGGNEQTQYYLSANWMDEKGIMIGSDHQKLNVRMNLDQQLNEWLSLAAGANYVRSKTNLVINGEQGFGGLLTSAVFTATNVNIAARDSAGRLINANTGVFPNPLIVVENWETPQENNRFVGSFGLRANPLSTLRLEHRLGFDRYELETGQSIPRGDPNALVGSAASVNRRNMLINNDLVANYDFGLAERTRLTTSAGMNHTYQRVDQFNLSSSDLVPFTNLVRGANDDASEAQIEAVTLGFFGQQQAAFANRLFLTAAVRFDASSTFGADERWQAYPKLSASWVVAEEPFWQGFAPAFITDLRLRAALGYAGNQPPLGDAYTRHARYTLTTNINRTGLVPLPSPGNPNLKPERQREWEAGIDASFLNDRIGTAITYYDKYTFDLLLSRPFTPSAGFASVLDNIGEMSNKGWEVELSTVNLNRARLGWNSKLIYSRNVNKLEKLTGGATPFFLDYTNLVAPGHPIGMHWLPAYSRDDSGVIMADSIGPILETRPCLGDPARVPLDPDCPVLGQTRRIAGNPWPDFTASLLNELRIGNFNASILLDGSFGAELWNQTRRIMDIFNAGPLFDQVLRVAQANPSDSVAIRRAQQNRTRLQSIWEYYLEDASYIKLRDFRVGYSTNADWLRHVGASRLQVEVVGRNLITWTDYSGYDPEVNMFGLSTVQRGTDFAVYPNPRTVGVSVRLTY